MNKTELIKFVVDYLTKLNMTFATRSYLATMVKEHEELEDEERYMITHFIWTYGKERE